MTKDVFWTNPRPVLTIEHAGGSQLGNCYYGSTYKITSTRALDCAEIQALRDAGFLGGGQEFYVRGQMLDGKLVPVPLEMTARDWQLRQNIPPTGRDEVGPTVVDRGTGKVLDEQAVNRYTGEPITKTQPYPFFVYLTENRTDSSD